MSARSRVKVGQYRQRGKKVFVVDLRREGIGRKFFKDEREANEWAELKDEELRQHGRAALLLTDADRLELFAAKEKLAPIGASFTEAIDFFLAHRKGQVPKLLRDGIGECLDAKINAAFAGEYVGRLRCVWNSFLLLHPEKFFHEVTKTDVESWERGQNWKPVTRKYNLKDLNTLFNYGIKAGWLKINPCKSVERIKVDESSKGILTPEQAEILLRTCDAVDAGLLRYFADQLFGGLREDEAANLTAKQSEPTFVHLPKTKIGRERFIEYNPTWKRWRRGLHAPIVNLRKRVEAIKAYARLEMIEMGQAESGWNYPDNGLRHSFCSYGAKKFGAEWAADMAGHAEATQHKHYRRPIPLEIAEAYWAI